MCLFCARPSTPYSQSTKPRAEATTNWNDDDSRALAVVLLLLLLRAAYSQEVLRRTSLRYLRGINHGLDRIDATLDLTRSNIIVF